MHNYQGQGDREESISPDARGCDLLCPPGSLERGGEQGLELRIWMHRWMDGYSRHACVYGLLPRAVWSGHVAVLLRLLHHARDGAVEEARPALIVILRP